MSLLTSSFPRITLPFHDAQETVCLYRQERVVSAASPARTLCPPCAVPLQDREKSLFAFPSDFSNSASLGSRFHSGRSSIPAILNELDELGSQLSDGLCFARFQCLLQDQLARHPERGRTGSNVIRRRFKIHSPSRNQRHLR